MDVSFIAKLLSSLLDLPVSVLRKSDIPSFIERINPNHLSSLYATEKMVPFFEDAKENVFYEAMDNVRARIFFFRKEDLFIVVGPYIRQAFSLEEVESLRKENGWDGQIAFTLRRMLFDLPVIDTKEVARIASGILVSEGESSFLSSPVVKIRITPEGEAEKPVLPNHVTDIETTYRKYELENALLSAVRQGLVEEVEERFGDLSRNYEKTDYERYFFTNPMIAFANIRTLIRKAAEQSGLSVIVIDEILAKHTQLMRKSTTSSEYNCLLLDFIREITRSVRQHLLFASGQSQLVRRACDFIYTRYADEITLVSLAKELKVSPSYLSRVFAKEARLPFNVYLSFLRLSKAAEMLVRSDLPVTQIALEVGYNDSSYFTKSFRKRFGKTPKEYRDSSRKEQRRIQSK